MNYLTEIRLFNEWLEGNVISTSAIALWHTLLYIAFRNDWQPEFNAPLSLIMLRTGLSRSSVYKERNILREMGLIDFDVGEGGKSNSYRFIGFEVRNVSTNQSITRTDPWTKNGNPPEESTDQSTTRTNSWTENEKPEELSLNQSATRTDLETQTEPQEGEMSDTMLSDSDLPDEDDDCRDLSQSGKDPYISIYINKDIDKGGYRGKKKNGDVDSKSPKKRNTGFDLSFIGDEVWEALVESWLEYKRSRSEHYKSELSVKKFHTMLRNYSRGDPGLARQIIDKSIANNWAGIFELAPDDGKARSTVGQPARPATGQRIGQIKQPEDEERRRKLLEKFGRSGDAEKK